MPHAGDPLTGATGLGPAKPVLLQDAPVPHRKLLKRREIPGHTRFITFSTYKRLPLFGTDPLKSVFTDRLAVVHDRGMFKLFAWVLMPEHVHLLLRPSLPSHPVPTILRELKRPIAKRLMRRWRRLDAPVLSRLQTPSGDARVWQHGGGYDRNITSSDEFFEKLRYIHRNPVTRGLVDRSTDWRWSSARWYAGDRESPVRIDSFR